MCFRNKLKVLTVLSNGLIYSCSVFVQCNIKKNIFNYVQISINILFVKEYSTCHVQRNHVFYHSVCDGRPLPSIRVLYTHTIAIYTYCEPTIIYFASIYLLFTGRDLLKERTEICFVWIVFIFIACVGQRDTDPRDCHTHYGHRTMPVINLPIVCVYKKVASCHPASYLCSRSSNCTRVAPSGLSLRQKVSLGHLQYLLSHIFSCNFSHDEWLITDRYLCVEQLTQP